jgi:hypothetical protein
VDVSGVKNLLLRIDPRENNSCDWSIWGDPVLSSSKPVSITEVFRIPTAIPTSFPTRVVDTIHATGNDLPAMEPLAWAIYYNWYQESMYPRAWSSDIWTDRPLVAYDSSDPDGVRQHIEWGKAAGLDGFLVEWCGIGRPGDNDLIDSTFGMDLDVAYQMNFKMAAYVDVSCIGDWSNENLVNQLRHLYQARATHPGFYWYNGYPVIVIYDSAQTSLDNWQKIFSQLKSEGIEFITVGMGFDRRNFDFFDGVHEYNPSFYKDLGLEYSLMREYSRGIAVSSKQTVKAFWAATVSPGFDNTPIINGIPYLAPEGYQLDITERKDGQTYKDMFTKAIEYKADWIIVTSWNEWQENSQIEPSQYYNDTYIKLTAEYLAKWRAGFSEK